MEVGKFQFSYVGDVTSFDEASKKVEKRLDEQEKLLKKSEKRFLTLNKVVLASGVGLSVLAVKNLPKLKSGLVGAVKGTGSLFNSLEKISLATKGVFGPFAKIGTALTGLTIGFETASFGMSAFGVSTAGAVGGLVKMGGVLTGLAGVALTGFISLVQSAADSIGTSLLAKTEEYLAVGARLETQTFALGLSLDNYRKSTGDASVTTASMTKLLDDLGRTTGITRSELKGGLTQMLNLSRATGLTSDQIKVLIERAADMSAALGKDFNEAVIAIDQSFKGYNAQLENFGVNITDGSLASTEFAKAQDRSVDSMSSSQITLAKFEDILNQTSTSSGALAKANKTIEGSALNVELAMESYGNRLGKITQEIFGPAIVRINELRASVFDLAGQGGLANLVVSLRAVGGVFFTGVAFILKWGSAIVIAKEVFKLFGFVVLNVHKVISLFSKALQFLSVVAQAASTGLEKLSLSTGKYAFVAEAARKASFGLGKAASGFGLAADFTEKKALGAASAVNALGLGFQFVKKMVLVGLKGLLSFSKILAGWSVVAIGVGAIVLSLVGILKSLFKTALSFAGIDEKTAFDFIKDRVEGLKDAIKDLATFLISMPKRLILSFEFVTNSITISVLQGLWKIGVFSSSVQDKIDRLRESNAKVAKELEDIVNPPPSGKDGKGDGASEFTRSRSVIKAQQLADLKRLEAFNSQEAVARRINFLQTKRTQIEKDITAITKPQIALQEQLVQLQEEQAVLRQQASTDKQVWASNSDEEKAARFKLEDLRLEATHLKDRVVHLKEVNELVKKDRKNSFASRSRKSGVDHFQVIKNNLQEIEAIEKRLLDIQPIIKADDESRLRAGEKLVKITEKIKAIEDAIGAGLIVNDKTQEDLTALRLEQLAVSEKLFELKQEERGLNFEAVDVRNSLMKMSRIQFEIEELQSKNRIKAIQKEKELLDVRRQSLQAEIAKKVLDASKAGTNLGVLEALKFELRALGLQSDRLALLQREKALRREILNELGPLNKSFQEARREELDQRVSELKTAGASLTDITRIRSEAEKENQRAIWNEIILQSNDSVEILRAKAGLYFEQVRTVSQKTADVIFSVFQSMDESLTDSLSAIATGMEDMENGFRDLGRSLINILISSLVKLGVEQAKTFLMQETGFTKALSGIETEGSAVVSLTSQYQDLAIAKANASGFGSEGIGGLIGPTLPGGGFFSQSSAGPPQIGPTLPGGFFNSGTGGAGAKSKISGAIGAAGFGALGGGLMGSLLGGPEGGQAGSLLGGIGAGIGNFIVPGLGGVVGGLAGSLLGGLMGRRKKKRRKREAAELAAAKKFLEDISELLEDESINISEAMRRVEDRLKTARGPAAEQLRQFAKDLKKEAKKVQKALEDVRDSLLVKIGVLQSNDDLEGMVSTIQSLNEEIKDLRKEFKRLPDKFPGFENLLNTFSKESLGGMLTSANKVIKELNKSFIQGAREDAGKLISVTQRAVLDIEKLNKALTKSKEERAKQIKDIENEGVAQRQKTVAKSKEERIKKLTEQFDEQDLGLTNQISTIEIVSKEQKEQFDKDLKIATGNRDLILAEIKVLSDKIEEDKNKFTSAQAKLISLKASEFKKLLVTKDDLKEKLDLAIKNQGRVLSNGRRTGVSRQQTREDIDKINGILKLIASNNKAILEAKTNGATSEEIRELEDIVSQFNPNSSGSITSGKDLNVSISTNPDGSINVKINPGGGAVKGSFASGGLVPSDGKFKLHKGEFVLNQKATSQALSELTAANRFSGRSRLSESGSGSIDLSINLSVGEVNSPSRVSEIEKIITNLQKKQLSRLRQVVSV